MLLQWYKYMNFFEKIENLVTEKKWNLEKQRWDQLTIKKIFFFESLQSLIQTSLLCINNVRMGVKFMQICWTHETTNFS
jgi:hypothetical protein